MDEMAEVFKLLGDKTRLSIIALLNERELCVCDIVDLTGMSQPNASQHLRKLKTAGLVNETRKRQWVYYSLSLPVKPYLRGILDHLPSMKDKVEALKGNDCEVQEQA